ncbi:MAG: GDP-mannose 4,6-dehydratase [Vicinamibacteria bacterium]|nr:GDP-mannose 4,6-dehydratase [Vicinamibacteria bacterium]
MRFVVTGAGGFIGSHLCDRLLEAGHDVVGIDGYVPFYAREIKERNIAKAVTSKRFLLHETLIEKADELESLLKGADAIYHLAAQAGVRASWGDDFAGYVAHNILGTQRLLEAAVNAKVPRLVYASSSSVYGDVNELPLRESMALAPVSPYGVTKLAAEHLVHLYGKADGLSVTSLRFFTVFGPRQRPDMAFHRFLKAVRDGQPITLYGDGEQTRDFTFIADLVDVLQCSVVQGRPGLVYNVGGGQRISVLKVLETIATITGREVRIDRQAGQKGDMRDTLADTALAARDLGFVPKTPLATGLKAEWEWICS